MGMHKGFTHGAASARREKIQTLREYIEQKQAGLVGESQPQPKKKLTFEEWFVSNVGYPLRMTSPDQRDIFYKCWKAAQENV